MTIVVEPTLTAELSGPGFAFVPAAQMRPMLEQAGPLTDWAAFAASWNDLGLDTYMADGGRYRRRRHAVFRVSRDGRSDLRPQQPHFQGLDHNHLNGGIDRWFEPVRPDIAAGVSMSTILAFCGKCFGALSADAHAWHVEVHQFRIEARSGSQGKPTPEGMHRDGVDHVLVLLIERSNIASGMTTIADPGGRMLGGFTLTEPFDAALVDDVRVLHGVTPVEQIDETKPAHRDVLVVTFRKST